MRPPCFVSFAFVCVLAAADSVAAQIIEPPPRSSNGLFGGRRGALDPNRTGKELSATFNMLGSYEDNVAPPDQDVVTDPFAQRRSGATGSVAGELRYRHGRATRSIESTGRGYVHSYRNVGVTPMYGGNADLFASTQVRRRTTLSAGASASYQPSFMLTSSAPLSDGATAPTDPTSGVLDVRTQNAAATSSAAFAWTPRQRTSLAYDYSRVRAFGEGLANSTSHDVSVGHSWDVRRSVGLVASYRLSELRADTRGLATRPTENQTATIGIELRRRISRTRTMLFNAGGGTMRVRTQSEFDDRIFNYTTPAAFAGARLDLGRTWAVAFDAHRNVSMLDGVTPQSFVNDEFSFRLGGRVAPSWLLAFYGSWIQGKPHHGEVGSFEAGNGSAQLQYNLTRCCRIVGSYGFYTHRLRDIEAVPAGFPRRFERNAVSVGISIFLPLYGQFSGTGRD